jgi:non-homologous end joining protein Ku
MIYRIRVLGMLDEKSKGKEIVIDKAPAPKHGQVIDIMEARKRSMERIPERIPAKKKSVTNAAAKKKRLFRKIIDPLSRQLQPMRFA